MVGPLPIELGGRGENTTGVGNVVHELSKTLSDRHELHYYCTNLSSKKAKKISNSSINYLGYSYVTVLRFILDLILFRKTIRLLIKNANSFGLSKLRFVFYTYNLKASLRKTQPDIIHIHWVFFYSVLATLENTIPTVLTMHGTFYREDEAVERFRRQGVDLIFMFKSNLVFAKNLTYLTKEMKTCYERDFSTETVNSRIISNAVDTKKFVFSASDRDNLRKQLSVLPTDTVFVTVASIQERKGQIAFIRYIHTHSILCKYWIVGTGPDSDSLKDEIERLNLGDRVHYLGYVNNADLAAYYSAADIYAHVSYNEGQSISCLEAISSGLKVLISENVAGTMAGTHLGDELIVLKRNPSAIEINQLKDWLKTKQPNRHIQNTSFSWQSVSSEYEDFYHKILTS